MLAGLFSTSVAQAPEAFPVQKGTVAFRQASKSYGDHRVLNNIDLQVAAGEVVAVCGPSGSGKSTLIRLINQLETLTDGEILVDGKPTRHLKGRELRNLRRHVGFVFQQFNLYAHLTALDNITLALTKIHGKSAAEAKAKALSLLERVGLQDKAGHYPSQLSGGQQQRVAIARTLAADPHIILFDEPTSALDPEMIGEVLQVMKSLAHSGITLIVVTHEMQFAREIADRVVFIDGGEILEQAAPEVFFTAPSHPRAQRFLQKVLNPLHADSKEL
ncbi:amino acid ABC transporter ATP-binding protein [Phytobacter sp. AG2a]